MARTPVRNRIFLEDFALTLDVGAHDFEIGKPQTIIINAEVWVDESSMPRSDDLAEAWNYDVIRSAILRLTEGRRYNLQEVLCREIFDFCVQQPGVVDARVSTRKPDIYADCKSVGIELSTV